MGFLVHEEELEVEFDQVSAPVPLLILVGVRKKEVGSGHSPDSVEEDKALGPSCGRWSPGC